MKIMLAKIFAFYLLAATLLGFEPTRQERLELYYQNKICRKELKNLYLQV